ncbi:hypothetical protein [Conexibacter woesei]|uniref:hypothetical protein n=1 Tax=Conexibacter woesei TaxID=191495 RepID=UPI000478BC8E|nr:hypothetical protein [Conexibacter woesei]
MSDVDPLASSRRRLARAKTHLDEFFAEIISLLENAGVEQTKSVADDLTHTWTFTNIPTFPEELGELLSEAIHNLRSPLDHIAWGFARLHNDPPPSNTAFPFCLTRDEWERAMKGSLKGVRRDAVEVIDRFQPYHSANPKASILWMLNRMWNEDKHRVPHVAAAIIVLAQAVIHEMTGGGMYRMVPPDPIVDGMGEMKVLPPPPGPDGELSMNIDLHLGLGVTVADGVARGQILNQFLPQIMGYLDSQVLPAFEALLESEG